MKLSGRAMFLLELMRSPDRAGEPDFMWDGEWFRAPLAGNIGKKTITELCAAGLIEAKHNERWCVFYRLTHSDEDFGDLWVAG
jgi:hypothetical protein